MSNFPQKSFNRNLVFVLFAPTLGCAKLQSALNVSQQQGLRRSQDRNYNLPADESFYCNREDVFRDFCGWRPAGYLSSPLKVCIKQPGASKSKSIQRVLKRSCKVHFRAHPSFSRIYHMEDWEILHFPSNLSSDIQAVMLS